ncbi:MAG: response regulator transcription factor [Acidobacteriia bacterium]|nr:response regulator transcription factor [Terriglobia bacterium]
MPDRIRILLIDDHVLVREAIARLLAAQPDFQVAGQTATIEEAVDIIQSQPVDIVLLDINLGSEQGGAFLGLAHDCGFRGRILVVTAGVSKREAARLLERGCAGIFLKHERPTLLIDRIRSIAHGEVPVPLSVPAGDLGQVETAAARSSFTPREAQVLRGVCSGMLNKEIAFELGISEPLVKAFVQQLFNKTGVRNRAQLVRVAVEQYFDQIEAGPDGREPV